MGGSGSAEGMGQGSKKRKRMSLKISVEAFDIWGIFVRGLTGESF